MTKKEAWGYIVWGIALAVFFIPEILASISAIDKHLPFTTLSGMTGHLEYMVADIEVVTIALIVFTLVSFVLSPQVFGGRTEGREDRRPLRTAGGRLTFQLSDHVSMTTDEWDSEDVPGLFVARAIVAFALIAFGTVAARIWWPDPAPKPGETNALFHPGYVLYGSIALFWFVIPSIVAFRKGKDTPYPTLFRTISNLEVRLRYMEWRKPFGPMLAWFLPYLIIWGLVFLLFHLTLYKFPDITHLLNPKGQ